MEILIGILIIAALMDVLHYKIPNWCIAMGMAAGMLLSYVQHGREGLLMTVVQTAVIFAAFYPFYLLKGMGAGDVKLFMLLGCYLREMQLWYCIGAAMVLAAAIAVFKLICNAECRKNVRDMFRYIRKIVITGAMNDDMPVRKRASVVRLSVPVLCSALMCMGGIIL